MASTKKSREARTRGPDSDNPQNRKSSRVNRTRGADADGAPKKRQPKGRVLRATRLSEEAVREAFGEDRLLAVARMAQAGMTDFEIASALDINTRTLWSWASHYEPLFNALTLGKAAFDERITRMLAIRALGYSYESEKVAINADGMITRATTIEHVPPDTTAMIFWLKNRRPAEWRDVKNIDVDGRVDTNAPDDRSVAMAIITALREATTQALSEDKPEPLTIENQPQPEAAGDDALGFRRKASS